MNVLQSFLVFLLWLHSAIALKGDSVCNQILCLNATVSDDIVTYEMTLIRQSSTLGWMAIGFGNSMVNTHMVVMWKNDDGTTTLSQRYSAGYSEPSPLEDPPRVANIANPKITYWHPNNSTTLAFQIPANKANGDAAERLIWAYSMTRPMESSAVSHIWQHHFSGHCTLNLSKEQPSDDISPPTQEDKPPPSPPPLADHEVIVIVSPKFGSYTKREKILVAHAIFISFGFLVLLPAGSLIARWGRSLTPVWFKAHQFSNVLLAFPVITLGWVLGFMAVTQHKTDHFSDAHEVCGILLVGLYYVQLFLGSYIHRRRQKMATPPPKPHPPLNVLHVALGLSMITLAFFQIRGGLDEWEMTTGRPVLAIWCRNLWTLWAVVLPLAYLAGLLLLKRQFRQEQSSNTSRDASYIALSENASTRLLFEVGEDEGDDNDPTDPEKMEAVHGKAGSS